MLPTVPNIFDGLPFVDGGFQADRLLGAIAGIRREIGSRVLGLQLPALEWLDPDHALTLRKAVGIDCELSLEPLSEVDEARVLSVRDQVVELVPAWHRLMYFPVKYHRLNRPGVESCSCYATPQRVFLSEKTLHDRRLLVEDLIHEHCHNWMYFLEELTPFHDVGHHARFVLPSGTANRNPTEVIGACHVAATLMTWYTSVPADAFSTERAETMWCYVKKCVATLEDMEPGLLLPAGVEIKDRLAHLANVGIRETRLVS